jgi:hypothetical protein
MFSPKANMALTACQVLNHFRVVHDHQSDKKRSLINLFGGVPPKTISTYLHKNITI